MTRSRTTTSGLSACTCGRPSSTPSPLRRPRCPRGRRAACGRRHVRPRNRRSRLREWRSSPPDFRAASRSGIRGAPDTGCVRAARLEPQAPPARPHRRGGSEDHPLPGRPGRDRDPANASVSTAKAGQSPALRRPGHEPDTRSADAADMARERLPTPRNPFRDRPMYHGSAPRSIRHRMHTLMSTVFDELRPPLADGEAVVEADRCLECGGRAPAPCVVACPADVDVPAFVAAIAEGDPDARRGDDLRREPARRHVRTRVSRRGALRGRLRPRSTRDAGRSRSHALQRYATDWALPTACRSATPRRRTAPRRRDRRRPGRARLRRRARRPRLHRHRLRRARRARRARPLRDRAVPASRATRSRRRRGRSRSSASASSSAYAIDAARRCGSSRTQFDAIVLAVGMGEDTDAAFPGDELAGVWESLPFIEAVKDGHPPRRRRERRRDRRRQHRDRRRREARRLGAGGDARLPADRGRDARLPARGREFARRRASASSG